MPVNKNALLRYQILDRCFSDFHRKYEIEDLLDKVNEALYDLYGTEVSIRQIRDDIKYMRDRVTYDAPIKAYQYDGKKCYYRYEDRNYSIFNNELSAEEVSTLRSTIDMLARFRDGSKNAWLEEVISNLEYRFGVKGTAENIVSFEQNEQLKGLEFLDELIDSAIHHQPLRILYVSYYGIEHNTIVHPYHVKQPSSKPCSSQASICRRSGTVSARPSSCKRRWMRPTDASRSRSRRRCSSTCSCVISSRFAQR